MAPGIVDKISSRMHRMSQSSADKENYAAREDEKSKLAAWEAENRPLEITEITVDPQSKPVGHSSKVLKKDDFELIKTLGTGTFARVWLAKLAQSKKSGSADLGNKVFALKILRKVDVIRLKQVEHVRNERNVLAAVAGHPFITTMVASFQDQDTLYMLLDYCPGGEVFSYLRRARRFNEPTSQFYAAEICLIFEFLHDKEGVAYRDLKPENILIDANGHLKLVDFGFAKKIDNRTLTPFTIRVGIRRLTFCRRNVHPLRYTRIPRARSNQEHWTRHRSRLVGVWHPYLRVPRRPATILGPEPNEDLRTDRRRQGPLSKRYGRGRTRHHWRTVHSGCDEEAGQYEGWRSDYQGTSLVQKYRVGCAVSSEDARADCAPSEGTG